MKLATNLYGFFIDWLDSITSVFGVPIINISTGYVNFVTWISSQFEAHLRSCFSPIIPSFLKSIGGPTNTSDDILLEAESR